jgi:hypothetical protein
MQYAQCTSNRFQKKTVFPILPDKNAEPDPAYMLNTNPGPVLRIPDQNFLHPGSDFFPSRIPDPHQIIKVFLPKKLFLSSRKYDPGCYPGSGSCFIYPYRIPVPRVKKTQDPGSGSATLSGSGFKPLLRQPTVLQIRPKPTETSVRRPDLAVFFIAS